MKFIFIFYIYYIFVVVVGLLLGSSSVFGARRHEGPAAFLPAQFKVPSHELGSSRYFCPGVF